MPSVDQEIELDLRSGVIKTGSLYEIGPRFNVTQNAVYGWRYPNVDPSSTPDIFPPHTLRMPSFFPPRSGITYAGSLGRIYDIGFTGHSTIARRKLIMGTIATSNIVRLWEAETGTRLEPVFGVPEDTVPFNAPTLGTSVYWSTPGSGVNIIDGTWFFSHRDLRHVYYIRDAVGAVNCFRSMTVDVPNCPPGSAAICVHIDRLWLADNRGNYGLSNIWYTDPFDAETIRATNFVSIDDFVNVITPTVPGNIDSSGLPHLFIGGANSIWIVDGDPTSLQALRRQVKQGVGCPGVNAAVSTEYGVFFLGTDYQIYLCSTDAREILPVGEAIRGTIGVGFLGNFYEGQESSLAWFSPYLYYFPANSFACYIGDMSDIQHPVWWGPIRTPDSIIASSRQIIKGTNAGSELTTPNGNVVSPSVYMASLVTSTDGYFGGFDRMTRIIGTYPNGHESTRQMLLTTGYFHKEGHDVKIKRVILETKTKLNPYVWTITTTNDRGSTSTAVRVNPEPIASSAGGAVTTKHFYTFPNQRPAVGKALQLSIAGPTTSQNPDSNGLDLLKARVVFEFTKANM